MLWPSIGCMQIHSLVTDFAVKADVFAGSCRPRDNVLFTEQCPGLGGDRDTRHAMLLLV